MLQAQIPETPPENIVPDSETSSNTKLYVLMYHHFVPDGEECNSYTLTESRFRHDLQWLQDNGYTTVLPRDLVAGNPLPEKAVMITFDDGYFSNYEIAFPLIKEYNAKIVISLITASIDRTITWDKCQEMLDSGLVEFGAHTHNLHSQYHSGVEKLPNESKEDYEIRVLNDIQLSKDLIEQHLNTDVYFFAHPYGKTEPWSNEYLQSEFKVTVTSEEGVADISDGFYNLPRYNISTSNPPSKYLVD